MKIVRFQDTAGAIRWGAWIDQDSAQLIDGDVTGAYTVTNSVASIHKLLAPIVPSTILCIGLNYREHAAETGAALPQHPVLFMKGINTLLHPEDPIVIPRVAPDEVDYECELAVVIGKPAKNVSREDALDYVLGYTCANDVSARRWQKNGGGKQWCRGKSFDTFCPLGPCIVTTDEISNPNKLRLSTTLNGAVMQDSATTDMIFDVATLVSFLSEDTTLAPGTVILTGTPPGVGFARQPPIFLKPGDHVTITIEHIGSLSNPVHGE